MKESIRYLREKKKLLQEEVAKSLGISRQTYIKYESGEREPALSIIRKLAELFGVPEQEIIENKYSVQSTAEKSEKKQPLYGSPQKNDGSLELHSSAKAYYGVFDGNAVRVLDGADFHRGQRFILYKESDSDETKRKRRAWQKITSIIANKKPYAKSADDDPFYKEAIYEAIREKHGNNN